eukprot:scaffold60862_cov41-Cyclotella_meneghiniana.AAC.5
MIFVDKNAQINDKDPSRQVWLGDCGVVVPDNATRLQNFILNMNIKQFKPNQAPKDALSTIGGGNQNSKGKNMYLDPVKLVDQVSFEWCEFGNFLCVKELQSVETNTPILFYNLCGMVPRTTIQTEVVFCLERIKQDLVEGDDVYCDSVSLETALGPLPKINIRQNVAHVPKAKNVQAFIKLPRHLQQHRRAFHIEVAAEDEERLKELVKHGKKKGYWKEHLGPHVHPSEVMTWDSSANDTKRAEQMLRNFFNYNASMTTTEVHGIHDINSSVQIPGENHCVSARYVITSLFRLKDGSSAVAEVHQNGADSPLTLVHPNIPEAESLVVNFAKHPGAFLLNYLKDQGVDEAFVTLLLKKIVDPTLLHEADHCKWDSENCAVTTPEELEEEQDSEKFGQQCWFKDIVAHFEEQKLTDSKKSRIYASAAALYDLDAAQSIKTTHEANDGVENAEELDVGDASALSKKEGNLKKDEDYGRQGEESSVEDSMDAYLSGHTPKSGLARSKDRKTDDAGDDSDDSSSVLDVTPKRPATASVYPVGNGGELQVDRVNPRAARGPSQELGCTEAETRQQDKNNLCVIDDVGAYRLLKLRSHLNVKSHQSTLSALEKRALRYQTKAKTATELDEDLVAGASAQSDEFHNQENIYNSSDWSEQEQSEIQQLLKEKAHLLEAIGIAPGRKADGIVRMVYENVNGLHATIGGNEKLEKLKVILDDLEADIFAFNEHKNNLKHKRNRRYGLNQLFFGGETMVRGIWGSNRHEIETKYLDKKSMEEGTWMVAFGEMASLMSVEGSGTDESGLARWTSMEFRGEEGCITKVLCGYVPCKNNRQDSGTSYQQQRRYFISKEKKDDEPRTRFLADMTKVLTKWKEDGHRIVVCLDANEDVYKDIIGRTLTDPAGLEMVESVHASTGQKLGATHFRGSRPIDAVWTTKDVEITSACAMPVGYGAGDHRMFVDDLVKESLVGTQPQAIVRPGARRLNSKIPECLNNYNKMLERLLEQHKLHEKLHSCFDEDLSREEKKERLDKIDEEAKQYMLHAEKTCRKIKCGQIPFSPEASLWIKRTQFYRSLLRFWNGKGKNRSNLKRAAQRCNRSKTHSLFLPKKLEPDYVNVNHSATTSRYTVRSIEPSTSTDV